MRSLELDGFAVLPCVFGDRLIDGMLAQLGQVFQSQAENAPIRSDGGSVYAARNVLTLWPHAAEVWRQPVLVDALTAILGRQFGLVRVLYFDKPPDRTWTLPWHKDLTIAVRDNRRRSPHFTKPTTKAGVPHFEAPLEVLEGMITARIHLDDVTEENGPLMVLPGSHRAGKELRLDGPKPQYILVQRGDVLLMRPLLAHCSGRSHPDTRRHRRILHLEFAASEHLPDGYAWHDFRPGLRRSNTPTPCR